MSGTLCPSPGLPFLADSSTAVVDRRQSCKIDGLSRISDASAAALSRDGVELKFEMPIARSLGGLKITI